MLFVTLLPILAIAVPTVDPSVLTITTTATKTTPYRRRDDDATRRTRASARNPKRRRRSRALTTQQSAHISHRSSQRWPRLRRHHHSQAVFRTNLFLDLLVVGRVQDLKCMYGTGPKVERTVNHQITASALANSPTTLVCALCGVQGAPLNLGGFNLKI